MLSAVAAQMAACWPKSRHTLLAVLGVVLLGLLGWRRGAGAGPRGAEPAGPVELRTVPDFGFTRDAIVAEAKATAALAWRKRALPNYVTLATTIWDRHPANVLVFGLGFDNALYYKVRTGRRGRAAEPAGGGTKSLTAAGSPTPLPVDGRRPTPAACASLWTTRLAGTSEFAWRST